jgi:hypothetical protein
MKDKFFVKTKDLTPKALSEMERTFGYLERGGTGPRDLLGDQPGSVPEDRGTGTS